jgi:membrane protein implicated in regulation of membrane protease activity
VLFLIALLLAIFLLPSPWGFVVVAGALVIDVIEISVGLWYSKRRRATVGTDTLVGMTGVAVGDLSPEGQVKVNGEIWGARCEAGCEAGATVVVRGVTGLTLEVEPARHGS